MTHRTSRIVSVVVILLATFLSQADAATRHRLQKSKRTRAARPTSNRDRTARRRVEAQRRAEAARRAAEARRRAAEEAMRDRVRSMIAKDDPTGEDMEIRRIAVNALGSHAGTVVVMNPKTGRVYTIVNQQWALREGFKPCSTIKLVTGLAGLNERVIEPQNTAAISDGNQVSLTKALAHSKNAYFQTVGGRVGLNKMVSYARSLGLGEKTGINVRSEFAGSVPKSKTGLAVNRVFSHGDDFKVTALQLATLASAMANGGKLVTPFVARTRADEDRFSAKVRRSVDIDSVSFEQMIPGMVGAVSYGSGRRAFDPQSTVAGKTGTCIENGNWVGLFTSYAPLNDPQLAIAVIARGADGRNHLPAAVAGRIYRELSNREASLHVADTAAKSQSIQTTTTEVEADVNEEEDEAGEEVVESEPLNANDSTRTIWGDQRRPFESKVKPTVMALPTRTSKTSKPVVAERPRRVSDRDD